MAGDVLRTARTMMASSPTISVLLPIYNAGRYLDEALRSILHQSFGDFELVAVNDGSTDGSERILQSYAKRDDRIVVISRANTGIVGALNDALARSRGQFVARMDADDASLPLRFEKQADFLQNHPDCVAVGCHVILTDPFGVEFRETRQPRLALMHDEIERGLLRGDGWSMIHPTVMMRRQAVVAIDGYRREFQHAEDIDLYLRLAEHGKLANLPDRLHRYRQHLGSVNHLRHDEQVHVITAIIEETCRRRGKPLPPDWKLNYPCFPRSWQQHYDWAWRALEVKRMRAAWRHALSALRTEPMNRDSWRLMLCVLRGR